MNKIIETIKDAVRFTRFEGKVFVVGGFVRDSVQNIANNDIDIAVAMENGGIELAKLLFRKGIAEQRPIIFETFGTAMTVIDSIEVEFVQTRQEKYDGKTRNPKTFFGTLEDDLKRRDFTINSMAIDIKTGKIVDLFGGVEDIQRGIIRTPLNPDITFEDDPLRIMRAIRFATRFGFEIEKETVEGIVKNVDKLNIISKERIKDEFVKMLECDNFNFGLRMLKDFNILDTFFKGMNNHTEVRGTIEEKLMTLFDDPIVAGNTLKTLKFTNKQIETVVDGIEIMNKIDGKILTNGEVRWLVHKFDKNIVETVFDILGRVETVEDNIEIPVNGADVIKTLNIKPGIEVGKVLNRIRNIFFNNPRLTKEELLTHIA